MVSAGYRRPPSETAVSLRRMGASCKWLCRGVQCVMQQMASALVVLVPEAEALVSGFRAKYDPSAAVGMPAHITLLFPFLQPDEIDRSVQDKLCACFARFPRFHFSLTTIRRFQPGVLYLAPEPDAPFREITRAIWDRYPETPPYSGKYADTVPHLTVAQVDCREQLDPVAEAFELAGEGKLPIHATTAEVVLMDNRSGRWQVRIRFALANSGGLLP
jgi:2'-5' RNA ligase